MVVDRSVQDLHNARSGWWCVWAIREVICFHTSVHTPSISYISSMAAAALLFCVSASVVPRVGSGIVLHGMRGPQQLMSASMPPRCRSPLLMASDDEDDGDALDAMDTVSDWDAELAEMKAWEASQRASKPASDDPFVVDEDAHLGLGDDDDEDPAALALRQMTEKQAALMLNRIEGQSVQAAPSDKAVLTSLEAVLNALAVLGDKVDYLTAKVDKLSAAQPAATVDATTEPAATQASSEPPAAKASSGPAAETTDAAVPAAESKEDQWDGQVDETAWFDDDGDDMPDWRDGASPAHSKWPSHNSPT